MEDTMNGNDTITRIYRNSDGTARAVKVTAADGRTFTITLDRGQMNGADLEVWDDPAAYGMHRYTCPGHNGHVCYYGMCDEWRYTAIAELRNAVQPAPVSPYVADPANPTDDEIAAAIQRGLADGTLVDSAEWMARNAQYAEA